MLGKQKVRGMNKELLIFLSHKKGDSERNARRIAGDLALFGGTNVKVICSANFEPGEQWEHNIRDGLTKANWLILLYTGPHTEWDWCLFETGFFRALMDDKNPWRRLICLHDPVHPVPAPLRGFVSVPATEDKIFELFEDIYSNDPWKLSPLIFRDNLDAVRDAVRRVRDACRLGGGPKYNLQIAPLINIRIKKTEIPDLERGAVPVSTPVTGEGAWETVFGKPEATAGWCWGELTEGVEKISAWEYQICWMMVEAVRRRSVQFPSIAIRVSIRGAEGTPDIYRIGLRRVAEYDNDFEFVFVLSRIRTPFEPSEDDRETMLYHLFNMAWHFRRRFIEHHRKTMEELAALRGSMQATGRQADFVVDLNEAVKTLRVDLKSLEADAQVRGLDRSVQIRRAFDNAERGKLDKLLDIEWPPLHRRLDDAIRNENPQPAEIYAILSEMEPINRWFCQNAIRQLSQIAAELRA